MDWGSRCARVLDALATDFDSLRFLQDIVSLTVVIGAAGHYYPYALVTVGGELHVPLTLVLGGLLLAHVWAAYLLIFQCSDKRQQVVAQALRVHPALIVSRGLRLGSSAGEVTIQGEFERKHDIWRNAREWGTAGTLFVMAFKQAWNIYGAGLDCCRPMLLTAGLSAVLYPFKLRQLSRRYTERQYQLFNVLFIIVRLWLFCLCHSSVREVCQGRVVTGSWLPGVLIKVVAWSLVPVLWIPVNLYYLQPMLPFHILFVWFLVLIALFKPLDEQPASWFMALDTEERLKCSAVLHLLPSSLALIIFYIWQYLWTCKLLSKLLDDPAQARLIRSLL